MTEPVKNMYQGLFVTETVLGNPNGSFVNNEPRNINGQVFTTDKCIKYNVRNYLYQNYENTESLENFVFFYPRKSEGAEEHQASYMTKTTVFKEYFDSDFDKLLDSCVDARIFGGTFSFKEGQEKSIYGPVQLSYGLDLIGADTMSHRIGTPFASDEGRQKTTGEKRVVDHAVIGYDITVNPNVASGLLMDNDLEKFKEGIIKGTNLRKSTSKSTDAKLLILVKFKEGKTLNLGELKHLIDVESEKITNLEERPKELVLNLGRVKEKLDNFNEDISEIELYTDTSVNVKNFYDEEDLIEVNRHGFNEL